MSESGIDIGEFSRMYRAGVSAKDMAAHFGCHASYISVFRKRRGLPARVSRNTRSTAEKHKAPVSKPSSETISSTHGRYALLCEYADRNGLTYRQALQFWHRFNAEQRRSKLDEDRA